MSRKIVSYLVLLTALVVLGAAVLYPQYEERKRKEAQDAYTAAMVAALTKEQQLAAKLPHNDVLVYHPVRFPRAQSAWRTAQKNFYQDLMMKGRFEILVVPFQVQDVALARDLRSLMTAQLAAAIGEAGKTVPDPYLVARALGDGQRRLDLNEVFAAANAIGAKRIVLGYVGYALPAGKMRVTLNVYDRSERQQFNSGMAPHNSMYGRRLDIPSEGMQSRHFENLAFSADTTPIEAWQAQLPEAIRFLGLDATKLATPKASRFEPAELPASPFQLGAEPAEPARDAYYLQLLAALAPEAADRERERLIEKSMLAVLRMTPDSPDYRALKARALAGLGLRPAALRALGTPASAEEKHLFALLNGNLPELQANRGQIPGGARALLAALEENAIAVAYRARNAKGSAAAAAQLKLGGAAWQYFTRRAFTDWDLWTQNLNIELKALLDKELPVEGFTAEAMLRGAVAVGDTSKLQTATDLSVLEHLRKHIQGVAAQWCCRPLEPRPGSADVVDVIEGIATDNLARRARFFLTIQGAPESAMSFLASIESAYKDHPYLTVVRGQAEIALAQRASGAEQEGLLSSAHLRGFNAWDWEQGQTRISARAFDDVIAPSDRQQYGGFDNYYTGDYPFRPFYPFWEGGKSEALQRNARAALENSSYDYSPVTSLDWSLGEFAKRWDEVEALHASLAGRFNGQPDRINLLAQASLRKGDSAAAQDYYRQAIGVQPDAEELYSALGKLLFEDAAQDKSASVFMSFPGLKKSSTVNPVGLSNYAYQAGSLYYWSGDFAHAIPLYKVAAGLGTGSEASMASESRLALLNGDYVGSLRITAERANRYRSGYAYRDYLGMLYALGYSKEAWEGFVSLVPQIDQPQPWEAVLAGHRRDGASEADISAWAAKEPMRNAGGTVAYAPAHLLRAAVTDRTPSPGLAAQIAALERPVWQLQNQYRNVVRAGGDGTWHVALGPDAPEAGTLARGLFDVAPKTRVKSDLVYYAEAYSAVGGGGFDAARAALEEASALYDMRNTSLGYLLPLYAYASARAGNTAALEKVLERFAMPYRRFDYHLAQAIIAATANKPDKAAEHLNLALHRRPFTEGRPVFTEYQYAEVCEWLFDATRDARYRKLAVDWAKKNQAVTPWAAWPYALEARLGSGTDRGRAIAMAHYLDPKSERLSKLPKGEVANAVREYANRNPFRRALDRAPKEPA